ncbi:hypothetical protein BDR05DRAFT_948329 [Suillus weaverae]|nr:hypothetical protein BDR05DRAFT_948329 [Suillus weaverae]
MDLTLRLALLLLCIGIRMLRRCTAEKKHEMSQHPDGNNFNDRRTTREDRPPWALLEFGCVIGITVRVMEEGRKAIEKGCPSTARVVRGRTMMSTACCRGLRVHRSEQELVKKSRRLTWAPFCTPSKKAGGIRRAWIGGRRVALL